jgi:hypothetical protein
MRRSYSYSKRETLESCCRRYFYEYYASAKAVPFDADDKSVIKRLKSLTNRHMLAGNILHSLIQTRLTRGLDWASSWFVRKAGERFDAAVAFSRAPVERVAAAYQPQVLSEFAYAEPDAEELAAETRRRLTTAISNFLHNDNVAAVYGAILSGENAVEQRLSGLRLADFSVEGKVDLVGYSPDRIDVIDWKMGESDGAEESLQLFAYGWWLAKKYDVPPERIFARKIFLTGPSLGEPVQLSDKVMRRGRARMVQDIELMKELDVFGREGNEEAFTPCEKINVCRQCSFRGICSAGSVTMTSRPTFMSLPVLETNH